MLLALHGFPALMEEHHRTFWSAAWSAAATMTPVPTGVRGARRNRGIDLTKGYLPAAALDLALHRSQTKALRLGESTVATARVEPSAQVPGKRRWYPPALRLNAAAPLCRRTPKQSGIHKEPCYSRKIILLILKILSILYYWRKARTLPTFPLFEPSRPTT